MRSGCCRRAANYSATRQRRPAKRPATIQQPRGAASESFAPFWGVTEGNTGTPPRYDWHEVLDKPGNVAGPRGSASGGKKLINLGDFDGRKNPDGTSTAVVYPPLPSGTRVRIIGFSGIDDAWFFDATPQPKRGPCP